MKKKVITDIILNIIIILCVSIGMTIHILTSKADQWDAGGFDTLKYFTNLSNVFCALIAVWVVIDDILILKNHYQELPHYLMVLRLMAACGVGVTFFTVAFIFVPILFPDCWYLYSGQRIMTHLTTPLLSMISFIFFAKGKNINWKQSFFSVIPELLYGVVYEIEVPILGNWKDFYGFTLGGKWYAPFIVLPVICGMAYGFSILLSLIRRKTIKE